MVNSCALLPSQAFNNYRIKLKIMAETWNKKEREKKKRAKEKGKRRAEVRKKK
jgi:hypothetical protein